MSRSAGIVVAVIGVGLVVVGLLAASGALGWFGRLPGDIRVEREGFRMYAPITSMLLVSLALSALAMLLRRLL